MKEQALSALIAARTQLINDKKAEADARLSAAFALPDVKTAHADYIKAAFANGMSGRPVADVESAHDRYVSALKRHGYSENDFEFIPSCPICGDLGVVGGKPCKCAAAEYVGYLKRECGLTDATLPRFDALDSRRIADPTQRTHMQKMIAWLKAYASKLPAVKYKTLVLLGGTGTGKTSLATALALAATDRGKSALIFSAYALNSLFLKCHTSPISEREAVLRRVMHADLLVIDDLGTEPILRNVTLEYLLVLLEERSRAGLCTVITSNLSMAGLRDRYQERVCSRLSERDRSHIFALTGADLRL